MNLSWTTVSFSEDDIGAGAAKLNTSAPRCSQVVLAGFEPTIFRLFAGNLSLWDLNEWDE